MTVSAIPVMPLRTEAEAAKLQCRFARVPIYGGSANAVAPGRPDQDHVEEAARCVGSRCAHWLVYRETTQTRVGCTPAEYLTVPHQPPSGDGWVPAPDDADADKECRNYDISTGDSLLWWARQTRGRCGLVIVDRHAGVEVVP